MKERPISYIVEMVRAILNGRKTKTRRVMRRQPVFDADGGCWYPCAGAPRAKHYASEEHFRKGANLDFSPYGVVGDRLYVREAARVVDVLTLYDGRMTKLRLQYLADGATTQLTTPYPDRLKWKPVVGKLLPRGCYREACRIILEKTGGRVERAQEITEADAVAEGAYLDFTIRPSDIVDEGGFDAAFEEAGTARLGFKHLWDFINAKRGHPWSQDDWVWVEEFKVLETGR